MRGLPPLQALLLLVVLVAVGFAGSHYISLGRFTQPVGPRPESNGGEQMLEAEIEWTFSTPPVSCTLKKPSVTGGEDDVLVTSQAAVENPCYHTLRIPAHGTTTYWLDVVWPDDPAENARHCVQVTISPSHGESQRFSFVTSSREMNETFDYSPGEHSHE